MRLWCASTRCAAALGLLLVGPVAVPVHADGADRADADAIVHGAPDDPAPLFDRARQRAWAGDYDGALADYRTLVAHHPDNPDYLLGKGQAHLWAGSPQRALPLLQRARELAPEYEEVWRVEHQARAATGNLDTDFLAAARERFADAQWLTPPPRRTWEVEGAARYDMLTRGFDDWQELRGDWLTYRPGALTWSGHVRQVWRFDTSDQEAGLAVARGFGNWTGRLDGTVSPPDDFLPDWSVGASLGRALPLGFGIEAGLRHSQYPDIYVDTARLTADRHFGPWRGAYSLFLTRLQSGSTATSHAISLTRFYQQRNFAGLTLSVGREDDYAADTGAVSTLRIRGAVLNGRHWFAPRWAVSWEAGYHEVVDTYERWGVQLGLRHSF